jgi:Ni/Fe-hydrogenase subunit HybB-like protein
MISRRMERFGGLLIATLSASLTIWNWQLAIYEGHFYFHAALIGPTFTMIGLGLLLFPSYRIERIERGEDLEQLNGFALLTPRWWGIISISLGSGLINLGALKGWQL